MSEYTMWHNPRCSKSRQTLALLEEYGVEPEIVKYVDSPPDKDAIRAALDMLGFEPRELMRKNEAIYSELELDDVKKNREELIDAMAEHPRLIERPVVIRGDRAAVGRPPENVLQLLDET